MVYKEVLPVLQGWRERRRLVRIQRRGHDYDGIVTEVSGDTGRLELSTAPPGGGKKTLVFEFGGADDFQIIPEPEVGKDWDEGFMVYLQAGDWLTLRKWKT